MQKHTKIYFDTSGIDPHGFVPCECCGRTAQDIHHIEARGMGGSKSKDVFENLQALCRSCHLDYGDKKLYKAHLKRIHAHRFQDLLRWDEENEKIIVIK